MKTMKILTLSLMAVIELLIINDMKIINININVNVNVMVYVRYACFLLAVTPTRTLCLYFRVAFCFLGHGRGRR